MWFAAVWTFDCDLSVESAAGNILLQTYVLPTEGRARAESRGGTLFEFRALNVGGRKAACPRPGSTQPAPSDLTLVSAGNCHLLGGSLSSGPVNPSFASTTTHSHPHTRLKHHSKRLERGRELFQKRFNAESSTASRRQVLLFTLFYGALPSFFVSRAYSCSRSRLGPHQLRRNTLETPTFIEKRRFASLVDWLRFFFFLWTKNWYCWGLACRSCRDTNDDGTRNN